MPKQYYIYAPTQFELATDCPSGTWYWWSPLYPGIIYATPNWENENGEIPISATDCDGKHINIPMDHIPFKKEGQYTMEEYRDIMQDKIPIILNQVQRSLNGPSKITETTPPSRAPQDRPTIPRNVDNDSTHLSVEHRKQVINHLIESMKDAYFSNGQNEEYCREGFPKHVGYENMLDNELIGELLNHLT